MKNKLIPIVVISITLTAGCSSKNGRSKTENPINNESPTATQKSTKTASHVKIPNSNFYIIPPPGFAANATTGTITNGDGHPDILVMNIISGSTNEKFISELKAQVNKDSPDSWNEEKITLSGHEAIVYKAKTLAGQQYYLVFNDGYTSEMIVVNYDESDKAISNQLYEALKTVVIEKP